VSGLEHDGQPPAVAPSEEPPETAAGRDARWAEVPRDITPAVGSPGGPAAWRRARDGAQVALARPHWGDAVWSFLYKPDTSYAVAEAAPGQVAEANRRARAGDTPGIPHGPFLHAPVWTWEVPVYFWLGGMASGAGFMALAADVAGDHRSARIARLVALGAVGPAPVLLIMDLGRPARFLNMLRIFKPRSPMNLGAWCLAGFSATLTGAVGADVAGYERTGRALGAVTAVLGGYLGSYTGVLLAATAVPLWARSRLFLGPIFVSTATATGAAATRLTLVAAGLPPDHPTSRALARLEAGAMGVELTLSTLNEKRLGHVARALETGPPAQHFRAAKLLVNGGFALQLLARRAGPRAEDAASVLYLLAGLAFRFAWVGAGKTSAHDDDAVARSARGLATVDDRLSGKVTPTAPRSVSVQRRPGPRWVTAPGRAYSAAIRRLSLLVESRVR
jgi:formate-dependent nitrite reductase membrane component NrfD